VAWVARILWVLVIIGVSGVGTSTHPRRSYPVAPAAQRQVGPGTLDVSRSMTARIATVADICTLPGNGRAPRCDRHGAQAHAASGSLQVTESGAYVTLSPVILGSEQAVPFLKGFPLDGEQFLQATGNLEPLTVVSAYGGPSAWTVTGQLQGNFVDGDAPDGAPERDAVMMSGFFRAYSRDFSPWPCTS